jgi:hypothetical protein
MRGLPSNVGFINQVAGRARRNPAKMWFYRSSRRARKCLRVQISQQTGDLDVADEIADDFDPVHSGDRKFYAREFFLDQDQQLELIERVKTKIVSEVRFVCNSFGIDT